MNVFLSWSGQRSRAVAEAIRDWLPDVLQHAKCWMSQQDIAAGAFWDQDIRGHLANAKYAIVCVTPENYQAPWLNYEAGALAERLQGATCPYLLRSEPNMLANTPLSRLQAKGSTKEGSRDIVLAINAVLESPLDPARCQRSFESYWPTLETRLAAIPEAQDPRRPDTEKLDEILSFVQALAARPAVVVKRSSVAERGRADGSSGIITRTFVDALIEAGVKSDDFSIRVDVHEGGVYGVGIRSKNGRAFSIGVTDAMTLEELQRLAKELVPDLKLT